MEKITINPNNEPYYSEDFIKGFECGTQRQLEADKADIPKWILCSERLPKENGEYLITLEFAWGREVEVGLWADEMWWNDNSHVNVAWMPLPEPMKGADDEDN